MAIYDSNATLGTTGIMVESASSLLVDVSSLKRDVAVSLALHVGSIPVQVLYHGNEHVDLDSFPTRRSSDLNLDLDNLAAGVIDATGGTLILQTGTTIDNAGLLEATATGTLDVKDAEINNTGATLDRKSVVEGKSGKLRVRRPVIKRDGTAQLSRQAG